MRFVKLSAEYGIVVRRRALTERGVGYARLLEAMEIDEPLDASEGLLSFGPHFGGEAASEFTARLQNLGLVYIDDFFVFSGDFPGWCAFAASAEHDGEDAQ